MPQNRINQTRILDIYIEKRDYTESEFKELIERIEEKLLEMHQEDFQELEEREKIIDDLTKKKEAIENEIFKKTEELNEKEYSLDMMIDETLNNLKDKVKDNIGEIVKDKYDLPHKSNINMKDIWCYDSLEGYIGEYAYKKSLHNIYGCDDDE